jgi:hypothetical protein
MKFDLGSLVGSPRALLNSRSSSDSSCSRGTLRPSSCTPVISTPRPNGARVLLRDRAAARGGHHVPRGRHGAHALFEGLSTCRRRDPFDARVTARRASPPPRPDLGGFGPRGRGRRARRGGGACRRVGGICAVLLLELSVSGVFVRADVWSTAAATSGHVVARGVPPVRRVDQEPRPCRRTASPVDVHAAHLI